MAIQVRNENELPTLRVRLDRTDRSSARAVFDVMAGADTPLPAGWVATRELGVPDQIRSNRDVDEAAFALPTRVAEDIVSRLADIDAFYSPAIWLELAFPRGYLHLVPWERLLMSHLPRPLLRLPNFTLRPEAPGPSLRVALCASEPVAKSSFDAARLLRRLVDEWSAATAHRIFIHVFTDAGPASELRGRFAGRPNIQVADPLRADSYPAPRRTRKVTDTPGEVRSPWLRWMSDELRGTAIDVVHFASHGYLAGDRGTLALASTPTLNTDTLLARFVGCAEVADFMCQTGAWALALSSPPGNQCPAALRDVADTIAQLRPGVTLVDGAEADPLRRELRAALTMVFGGTPSPQPLSSITCWSHPKFVAYPESSRSDLLNLEGHSTLIAPSTLDVLGRDTTPTWVASGTRIIETTQAEWAGPGGQPDDPDAVAALRSVSAFFDEHVRTHGSGAATDRPRGPVG